MEATLATMKTSLPSNQSFGWTFTGAFVLAAILYPWALAAAALTALLTLAKAQWLTPFNRAWMKLGELMSRVANPLMLGLIFFGVFTPTGIVMRLAGRDVLARQWDPTRKSYWVKREPPGPTHDSFDNMF
jgi:hypothetical protein